ncbi:MAG: HDIG domain-containing metalloprotein [Spirochaetota bacterium]
MKFLETQMAFVTDVLTKVRPLPFVRKLQFLLVFITLVMVTSFEAVPYLGYKRLDLSDNGPYAIGNFSPKTIVSSKEITYNDLEKTRLEKEKAYNTAPYIFERDYKVLADLNGYIKEDFRNLAIVSSFKDSSNRQIKNLISKNPRWRKRNKKDLKALLQSKEQKKVQDIVLKSSNTIFSTYCILREVSNDLPIDKILTIGGNVINKGSADKNSLLEAGKIFPRTYIYDDHKFFSRLKSSISSRLNAMNIGISGAITRLSISYIYSFPACTYNPEETEKGRKAQENKVTTVINTIAARETVVRKGKLITPEINKKLKILNERASKANLSSITSLLMMQIIFISIISMFLKKYDRQRLNDVSSNVIVFTLIWLLTITTFLVSRIFYHPDASYENTYFFTLFVPIGLVPLLLAFIYDQQLSIAIGVYLSLFVFIISRNNATCFFIALTTTIVSSIYGKRLTKRIDFIKYGFVISGIQILVATSGYLIYTKSFWVDESSGHFFNDLVNSNMFKLYLACTLNGFICITAAQFLLPLYEYVFNIPTRFKLMELADTGHPLLQALLTRAPSTYTHTFMVAAMSERAAQNLKLNWLLTRVGVYYHDIGKIPNAGFFIENQHLIPKPENVDKNNPSIAASVVIRHVTEGIEMAKKARLPREVIDFIPEHHGTSTMAFFYHKALADLTSEQRGKVRKEDFQYPGPKPQKKETGIVMIADSVEAASRSLDEVTPKALDELIQKIINIKLAENQLDESNLTIGDLAIIKESFKEILLSSLHSRPKYPKPEDTKKLEQDQKDKPAATNIAKVDSPEVKPKKTVRKKRASTKKKSPK